VKIGDFLNTHEGALTENRFNRFANVGLAVAVLVLLYMVNTKDQIIVIQPTALASEAWISTDAASQSYKEAWGFHLAQLTGNVTPANVDFLKERLKPLLSPAIYSEVVDTLEIQAQDIRDDRITMRFEPRVVEYETTTDKVFVYGYSFIKGSTGNEDRKDRTYEYRLKIENYAPLIVDINTYEGKPRSEQVLAQLQKQEERRSGGKK
tara:strand:- start:48947 stop:49567 length:621 start_codon:yes stop_codon:yes gene_type:complete